LNNTIKNKEYFSTNFLKWFSKERDNLFTTKINYCQLYSNIPNNSKISDAFEGQMLENMQQNKLINDFIVDTGTKVYYHNAPVHWNKVFDFIPNYIETGVKTRSSHLKHFSFVKKDYATIIICLLNSSLFYWYNWQYTNCRDLSLKDIQRFPCSLDLINASDIAKLSDIKKRLMEDLKKHSKIYKRVSKGIETSFDSFYPMLSKPIIDEIDLVLAKHYGFTDEELDFIINYDIKYRMGGEETE
jgi:ferritin